MKNGRTIIDSNLLMQWSRIAGKLHHCLKQFNLEDLNDAFISPIVQKNENISNSQKSETTSEEELSSEANSDTNIAQPSFLENFEILVDNLHEHMTKEKITHHRLSSIFDNLLKAIFHNLFYFLIEHPLTLKLIHSLNLNQEEIIYEYEKNSLVIILEHISKISQGQTKEAEELYAIQFLPIIRDELDLRLSKAITDKEHLDMTQWIVEHFLNIKVGTYPKKQNGVIVTPQQEAPLHTTDPDLDKSAEPVSKSRKRRKKHKNPTSESTDPSLTPTTAGIQKSIQISQTVEDEHALTSKEQLTLLLSYMDIPSIFDDVYPELRTDITEISDNHTEQNKLLNVDIESSSDIKQNFNWLIAEGALLKETSCIERKNRLKEKWILVAEQSIELKKVIKKKDVKLKSKDKSSAYRFHQELICAPFYITNTLLRYAIVNELEKIKHKHIFSFPIDSREPFFWNIINTTLLNLTLNRFKAECSDQMVYDLIEVHLTYGRHQLNHIEDSFDQLLFERFNSYEDRVALINSISSKIICSDNLDDVYKRPKKFFDIIKKLTPWVSHLPGFDGSHSNRIAKKLYVKLRILEENESFIINNDHQTLELIKFKLATSLKQNTELSSEAHLDILDGIPNPIIVKKPHDSKEDLEDDNNAKNSDKTKKKIYWHTPLI